ncbi:MAG: hypothetical protein R3B96_13140 [Pirellulaceae bacterium]
MESSAAWIDPDGTPHLRIEQRVPSSGPTVIDMAANIAFYFGLVETLAQRGLVAHRGAGGSAD